MDESKKTKIRPSRIWYLIGIALFLIGGIASPTWFIISLISSFSSGEQFIVPTARTFILDKPGKYVIWHDAKTFFQGKTYSFSSELPDDVTIKVIRKETQEELTLNPSTRTKESSGSHKRYSICSFSVETPGEYSLEVSGLTSPHVFTLRKSLLRHFLYGFLFCIPLTLIGWIGTPLLIIIVAVKRSNARKRQEELMS